MSRRNYIENEAKIREELHEMLFSEVREKLYEYRKQAMLHPSKESITRLKNYIRYIKDELDL